MLIENYDPSLTNPYQIRDLKRRLLLDWLLAFRFSSVDLLTQRLGLSQQNIYKLVKDLEDTHYIQNFVNIFTGSKRLVMLTQTGATYLAQKERRNVSRAVTKPYRLIRNSRILHDLAIQKAAVKRTDYYTELISDHDINLPEPFHRPDLLMHSSKDFWIAFEYERTRKEGKRIYIAFNNHAQAIIKQHYHAVYFLFDREHDLDYYHKLFNATEWPRYNFNRNTGKITQKSEPFKPDEFKNLRKCFLFIYEPARL